LPHDATHKRSQCCRAVSVRRVRLSRSCKTYCVEMLGHILGSVLVSPGSSHRCFLPVTKIYPP